MKLVIFDVDGTLVDSQAHILAAMGRAFAAEGLPAPDRAAVLSIIGLSLPEAMLRLAGDATEAARDRLVEGYKTGFADLRAEGGGGLSPLYPGARAVLDRIAAWDGVEMAIATGKSRRGMDYIIEMHGFAGLFASVQTADTHPSKPHPSMIETCLSDTGVTPENACILGDTVFDMAMGKAAGVTCIGVNWGYHPAADLAEAGAATVLTGFEELVPWLAARWGVA